MRRKLKVAAERFPIAGKFTIARGSRTEAIVVTVTIEEGEVRGRGEGVPYARYGETVEGVVRDIEALRDVVEAGLDRTALQERLPPGAARNAVDCALWDLDAKRTGVPATVTAGLDRLSPPTTAYTISLDSAEAMGEATERAAHRPILKIKLGGPGGDLARIAAVRRAAPDATLIADANEGWSAETLAVHMRACRDAGFVLVEQPLKAGEDAALAGRPPGLLVCADESVHTSADLAGLVERYDAVNIKLDKAGGLTEGLAMAAEAERLGFAVMIGCMLGTSLAMAPALLLTPRARFTDLDGPLLLGRDRDPGLRFEGSLVHPAEPALWG